MSTQDHVASVSSNAEIARGTHKRTRDAPRSTSRPKTSIGFLLAESDSEIEVPSVRRDDHDARPQNVLEQRDRAHTPQPLDPSASSSRKTKRRARVCREPGCDKYVVDHGLCIRHGGGKRCNVEGCNCRAQNRGLCWKHGGFTICTVDGCAKRAKSRGICWSHGGGTRCKQEGCAKIAVSQGLCWAHGGGKRCMVDGCKKPASERTNNLCSDHFVTRSGASTGAAE